MKKLFIFSLYIAILGSTGCLDDPDCNSRTTDFVNIQFFSKDSLKILPLKINMLEAINSDSIFFQDTTLSRIALPLEPNTGSTTFAFNTEKGLDTLILSYSNRTRLVSDECGLELIFEQLDTVRSDFDSIAIVNRSAGRILSTEITEDVEIYN